MCSSTANDSQRIQDVRPPKRQTEAVPVLEARHLTKRYRVYVRPFDRLKEALTRRPCHRVVAAIEDVSFEVSVGACIGIIGENGAGKSTLLKILAGTLQPTSGDLVRVGKAAALLELGSGFHPEFSGRRNIYLNAALLGLEEREIREREREIVAFSELEGAIDLPVKTYSTGMYMRLAFSIATSVDPDILIVDEALSVGDQRFQQKCVDRMVGFVKGGKTLVICSHSMYLITELCSRALWLSKGRTRAFGRTRDVVAEYMASATRVGPVPPGEARPAPSEEGEALPEVRIVEVRLLDESGREVNRMGRFAPLILEVRTRRAGPPLPGHFALGIERPDGEQFFVTTTKHEGLPPVTFCGEQVTRLSLPSVPFQGAGFKARAVVGDVHGLKMIDMAASLPFTVESDRPEMGFVWIAHHWLLP